MLLGLDLFWGAMGGYMGLMQMKVATLSCGESSGSVPT